MTTRVLCFGDSNTWGAAPDGSGRWPYDVRWPGVLAATLGEDYTVLESGLGGRTTVFDDPTSDYRNGKHALPMILQTHMPLDIVVIMLGTNDLKGRFSASAFDIADGARYLLNIALASNAGIDDAAPIPLLVCPPPLAPNVDKIVNSGAFRSMLEKSQELAANYERVATELGVAFLDAGTVIETSMIDGVHLDENAHRLLAEAVAEKVRAL